MAQVASYDFAATSGYGAALGWTTAGKVRTIGEPWDVFLSFVEPAIPDPITCTWEMLPGPAPWRIRGTFSEAVRYHALLIAPSTYKITPPDGKRTPNVLSVEVDDIDEPTQVTLTIDEPFVGGAYTVEILAVEPPEDP